MPTAVPGLVRSASAAIVGIAEELAPIPTRSGASFAPKDVSLVRRNESKVVISGLGEGQEVALANPAEMTKKKQTGGVMPSIAK